MGLYCGGEGAGTRDDLRNHTKNQACFWETHFFVSSNRAVMVNKQFIMMIEHQFTINPNMPLQFLEYITRIYGNVDNNSKNF